MLVQNIDARQWFKEIYQPRKSRNNMCVYLLLECLQISWHVEAKCDDIPQAFENMSEQRNYNVLKHRMPHTLIFNAFSTRKYPKDQYSRNLR